MFNWATEKLEKLSQTVAPPPDDPSSRFVYCVQKNDEAGAQGCLAEIDPLHTIVQSTKGTTPLHLACGHSMATLIRQIMAFPGASMEITDAAGNTPLHHASMSTDQGNAVYTVRMLVTEYNASVVAKNWQGQTPYDMATLNGIRQYLLPIQLQQETQQAIDNGGVGLPPGIDMGGLRISQPAMPPPPIGGMGGGAPPTPPSGPPNMLSTPSPNMPPTAHAAPAQPTAPQSANAPAALPSGSGQFERSASAPSSGNSHTYSRSGSSSAAVLSKAKFRPDGFHSSSSDVSLQKKYGHSSHGTPAAAIPPPPSSGNSAGPPTSAGANPYAAGASAFGSANRYGPAASRYPIYGGQPNVMAPPPGSGGYTGVPQQAAAPTYSVFQPGAQPQQQAFSSEQQRQQQPTTPFMSPPPYQQQPQQPAYQQHGYQQPQQQHTVYQQPQQPGYQQQPAYQQPQQPGYQQPMTEEPQVSQQETAQQQPYAQPPMPGPYPVAHTVSTGNVSAASAEELFASPTKETDAAPAIPAAEPATRTITSDSARSSFSSAQELFASSAFEALVDAQPMEETNMPSSEGESQGAGSNSAEGSDVRAAGDSNANAAESSQQNDSAVATDSTGTAADYFGSNGSVPEPTQPVVDTCSTTAENVKEDAGESAIELTDGLDDVPLEEVPLTPSEGDANEPQAAVAAQAPAAFSSVGLPPPPFSSRQ